MPICRVCSTEKPDNLFVIIKGKRIGMVCRLCRNVQIVNGRKNKEAIAEKKANKQLIIDAGCAKCSKCLAIKSNDLYPSKLGKRHGSVCLKCTSIFKKQLNSLTEVSIKAKERKIKAIAKREDASKLKLKNAELRRLSLLPASYTECAICKAVKVNTEFNIHNGKRHGKRCSSCAVSATKEFRKKRIKEDPNQHRAMRSHEANLRRAELAKRSPKWCSKDQIISIYINRPYGYHVDHIIPLFGKLVSGLHVAENLQYLTATENMKKNRKFTIEG